MITFLITIAFIFIAIASSYAAKKFIIAEFTKKQDTILKSALVRRISLVNLFFTVEFGMTFFGLIVIIIFLGFIRQAANIHYADLIFANFFFTGIIAIFQLIVVDNDTINSIIKNKNKQSIKF